MRLHTASILLLSLLAFAGCLPSEQEPANADLRAADTPSRVPAIVIAGDTNSDAKLRELIHALSDKDPAVRLFAIQALEKRTGQTLDYRYYEGPEKRQAAINRWHTWLSGQAPASDPMISGCDAVPTTDD